MNALVTLLYLGACVLAIVGSFRIGRGEIVPVEQRRVEPEPVFVPVTALPKPKPKSVELPLTPFAAAARATFDVRGGADSQSINERLSGAASEAGLGVDPEALLLVGELEADDFPAAVEAVLAMPAAGRKELLHAVLARWANFEPEQAAEFVLDRIPMFDSVEALSAVVGSWASHDGDAAFRWAVDLLDSEQIRYDLAPREMMSPLFFAWAKQDLQAAGIAAGNLRYSHRGTYAWKGIGKIAGLNGERDTALGLALQMPPDDFRDLAIGQVVGTWADHEPAAAAEWLDREELHDFDIWWQVFKDWVGRDPLAAAEWTEGRAVNEEERQDAIGTSIINWAQKDLEGVASWLEGVAPNDENIQAYAEYVATVDIAEAVEWAKRATPQGRDKVIANTLAKALKHDRNAYVAPYLSAGSISAAAMAAKVGVAKPDPVGIFD